MKILFISPDYKPSIGGVEKYVNDLINGLASKGIKSEVFCGNRTSQNHQIINNEMIDFIPVYRNKMICIKGIELPSSFSSYIKLLKLIKNVDIIHLNDIRVFFFSTYFLSIIYNKKLIITPHGFVFHTSKNYSIKLIYMTIISFLIRLKKISIIVSGVEDAKTCEKFCLEYQIIEPGLDLTPFKFIKRRPVTGNYLYYGRLDENKDIISLLKCFGDIVKRDKSSNLFIAGNGSDSYIKILRDYTVNHDIRNYTHFLGKVSNEVLYNLLAECEFLIIPSINESSCYAFMESSAAGCTIICKEIDQFVYFNNVQGSPNLFYDFRSENFMVFINKARSNYTIDNIDARAFANKYSFDTYIHKYLSLYKRIGPA